MPPIGAEQGVWLNIDVERWIIDDGVHFYLSPDITVIPLPLPGGGTAADPRRTDGANDGPRPEDRAVLGP
ncbi:hypothetical protein ACFU98_12615, partial [Streptomyces sp. NPDC057575]|uniref:hypothetical protein n=1 Tax=Streptomyces sp. NPDC057575 TaxID=3346170 RepID=UPI0036A26FF3